MRTEDSNNTIEKFKKIYRIYVGVLQPVTVLKTTDCFLVISEAVISMCLKNDIENF